MTLVSVILVSYNTRALTVRSVESVKNSQGFKDGEIETIVVDNNSPDDTIEYLRSNYSDVKVIKNKTNLGFGAGNNQGVNIAKGKYLLLLNTDAFLSPDSLRVMVDLLEKNDGLVSVAPQLLYEDGRLQPSGGYLPTPGRVIAWMWWLDKLPLIKQLFHTPYHVYDPSWYKRDQYPEWLMGACVMFRRAEFLAVGGFDDKIFMYAEEVELYRRLKESFHKQVFFTPKTQVIHLGGVSTKKASASRLVYELKGIEYIYAKYSPSLLWLIKVILFSGIILRIVVFNLIPGRQAVAAEYLKYFKGK